MFNLFYHVNNRPLCQKIDYRTSCCKKRSNPQTNAHTSARLRRRKKDSLDLHCQTI